MSRFYQVRSTMLALVVAIGGIASLLGIISTVPAAALDGKIYNMAKVTDHNFIETWTTLSGGALHIKAVVSNGDGGTFGRGPFAPIVTLAFSLQGKKTGELKLVFNVPAIQKDQTHEIDIPNAAGLWLNSDHITASAANNPGALPPSGTWKVVVPLGG